jgi:hypothetical protein
LGAARARAAPLSRGDTLEKEASRGGFVLKSDHMEIRINVPEELATQARARGVSVKDYIEELLAEQVELDPVEKSASELIVKPTTNPAAGRKLRTPEQIRAWLDSLARFSDKIPPLPETISREWIYQDHE